MLVRGTRATDNDSKIRLLRLRLAALEKERRTTYAHAGSWFTEEEKFTVAAEKEYSEETGFNLKRLDYGRLGERIDH